MESMINLKQVGEEKSLFLYPSRYVDEIPYNKDRLTLEKHSILYISEATKT